MARYMRAALGLALFSACVPAVLAKEAPLKVEIFWVEARQVEGLTEDEGFQSSCDPKSIVYPHKKPALVLTAAEVSETRLTQLDLSKSGLSSNNYMVALHLTKEARDKLAASCKGQGMRLLTVAVDGKYWGLHRYEKENHGPAQVRAESFVPEVGYFSSRAEAERLVDAFK